MICVVGPGAVGGLLTALLERAGRDVVVVARERSAARLRREGLTVRSARVGTCTAHPRVRTTIPEGSAVVLAVKSYGLPDILPLLEAARPSEVLTLLNGLDHVARVRELPGVRAVAGASISVEALRTDAGIEHRSDGVVLTAPAAAARWRSVTGLADAGVAVRTGGTEQEVLWAKLRMLAATALLTSYWAAPIGEARSRDPGLTAAVVGEIAAVATASGVPTDASAITDVLHRLPSRMRSSLQHDLEAGGPSELEHVGGALLHRAQAAGVAVPALGSVVGALRQRVTSTSR